MITTLANNIREDFNNGIIASVHDESHINAYLRNHRCKMLPTELNRPEEWMDNDTKMIFRAKQWIDSSFIKDPRNGFFHKAKKRIEKELKSLIWLIG